MLCYPAGPLSLLPRSCFLGSASTEVVGSGLVLWRLLAQAYSAGGLCLESTLAEFAGSGLLPWRSLAQTWTFSADDPGLNPVPQRSLASACFLDSCSFIPVPVEFADLGLLWWRSLAQACSKLHFYIKTLVIIPPHLLRKQLRKTFRKQQET